MGGTEEVEMVGWDGGRGEKGRDEEGRDGGGGDGVWDEGGGEGIRVEDRRRGEVEWRWGRG